MAKGRKTGGRNFKKGQSGNPRGPEPLPEDIKAARKINVVEFERIVNKFLFASKGEVIKVTADPNTPVLELMVGAIVHKAVIEGDERRLDFILNRLIGKVKEQVEHSAKDGSPLVILTMPRNGREAPIEIESSTKKKKEPEDGRS